MAFNPHNRDETCRHQICTRDTPGWLLSKNLALTWAPSSLVCVLTWEMMKLVVFGTCVEDPVRCSCMNSSGCGLAMGVMSLP
jgi:hypothetical protein